MRPVPLCKLFCGLVAGTSPLVCADFYAFIHLGGVGLCYYILKQKMASSHDGNSPSDLLQEPVVGSSPLMCADLNSVTDLTLVPGTSPTNLTQFEFLGQVHATCSSKCFV